jgi:hypothetical protein
MFIPRLFISLEMGSSLRQEEGIVFLSRYYILWFCFPVCGLGMGPAENTAANSFCIVAVVSSLPRNCDLVDLGSMFTEPMPSIGRLFWFCYPGFQQTCHSTKIEVVLSFVV